jgi:outer membrane immunogenic protein
MREGGAGPRRAIGPARLPSRHFAASLLWSLTPSEIAGRWEAQLAVRSLVVVVALAAPGAAAWAGDYPPPGLPEPTTPYAQQTLPSLAQDPQAPSPSVWKGLYVGTDIFFSGGKGVKGLIGGGGFVGYDRRLDNNLVIGVEASTGFAPFSLQHSPFKGYDYAEVSARVGYEMGRVTPFLTAGVALSRPNGAPGAGYLSPADSANALFDGAGGLSGSGVFGAGFNYALTSTTTVGLAAVVGTGRGFAPPP